MGLLGGSSKSSSSTTAQQPTANSDEGSTSTINNLGPISAGKGSDISVSIQSLDAVLAGQAIDAMSAATGLAYDFAGETFGQTADRAFDFLDAERRELAAARNLAISRDAALAAEAFALADEKTTSTDDRVLGLGKIGLFVGSALLGLVLLVLRQSRKS